MRISLTSILLSAPFLVWAVAPTPNTVLDGNFVLNGGGSTIDATTLPSLTGYFMNSGTLDMSDVTLQNFHTTGGSGSGGGGGFGGTLFINDGVVVNLSNVNFIGSTVTGGTGGMGDTGGVLNGILVPISSGATGADGSNPPPLSAYINSGNGRDGYSGFAGGDGINGFGGNGGNGGFGDSGLPAFLEQEQAVAEVAALSAKTIATAITSAALTAEATALGVADAAQNVFNADPFLAGYPAAISGVIAPIIVSIGTTDEWITANQGTYDTFVLGLQTALVTAYQVTGYITVGVFGNGGNGGVGAVGGAGSDGFGGGRGGNGGDGGDAVANSNAIGGVGGAGGPGGIGGFGGGGGRGGDLGKSGASGNNASNGPLVGVPSPGGVSLFGGGVGSFGDAQIPPPLSSAEIGGGGGGFGLGGAIFVRSGGTLNINGPALFCSNNTQGGISVNNGNTGSFFGNDLFMVTGATVVLDPGAGNTISFSGSIADDSGATSIFFFGIPAGAGAGLTINSGLVILGAANSYSGPTDIFGGVVQAADGVGISNYSHINLAGGILEGNGNLTRYLGTQFNRIEFAPGVSSGLSAANGDFFVSLNCGSPLTWGQPLFIDSGSPFLFGSPSATDNVIFHNDLNLAGVNQTILATASAIPGVLNQAIFEGVLSNGSLTIGDPTHTGIVALAAINTYTGPTHVAGGTLLLTGSIQSTTVTIDTGATMEDVNGGLAPATDLTVNGTFILDNNTAIDTLAGSGTINLNGGTLTINSGSFSGPITGTSLTSGITKISPGNLTLSGASTYVGPTLVSAGTLTLTGSLQSQVINVSAGALLDDVSGGLSPTAIVTIDGDLNIGAAQTIGTLFGTGNVDITAAPITIGNGNFSGVISGANPAFGLTKDTTGTLILSGANTYVGPTLVTAGSLILQGSLASNVVTISTGATMEDVNGGLAPATVLTVNGTFNMDVADTVQTLNGAGVVNLVGGTITVGDGNFAGTIAGTNPSYGLIKTSVGTLTLTGPNTFAGPTDINQGTLTLSGAGTLASPTVNVAVGATLNDNNGGLSNAATLTNAGLVNLPVSDTILALINSGTINGAGTLTAPTYALNNGSLINANLGAGVITSNGTVQLNGTTAASVILIQSGTMTLGGPPARLLSLPDVTANGTLVLGTNEAIDSLFGTGAVAMGSHRLTVNNGTFSGAISGTASSQLIKVSTGILTLSGANTYTGITQINAGELTLTGSLASLTVNVAAGAILDDNNSGLAAGSTLTNAGLVNLPLNDTILALINSGEIDGLGTLTASTYTLNNGSLINANLGTGVLTTNVGVETLNGTSAASIVTVNPGSTFNLGGNQRLSSGVTLTVNGILNLPLFDQTINILNGLGGQIFANNFQINNGGTYSGLINSTTSFTVAGGVLNLNNTVLNTSSFVLNPGATLNFNGAGTATTDTVSMGINSTLNVSNSAIFNNSSDITIPAGALLSATTSGRFFTGGNIFLNSNGAITLDATGRVSANTIQTGLNSLITVPDSSRLTYNLLTGFGTVDSLGGTFVNNATVTGEMIFLNNFTNLGTLSPGFSPGLITIGGNYVEGGHLILDVLTTTAITGYDQVRVGGTASLLPTSVFDVHMSSSVIVPGNFFQVIATSAGGPIPVSGVLGSLTLTVDGTPSNPNIVVWDAGTGRILISGIGPTPPGPPGPNPKKAFFNLGCTSNQDSVAKGIFSVALITPTQIDTSTTAGQLAAQILAAANPCTVLGFYTPTYYGGMSDYAFMGDRAMASQVWNRVSAFASLPEQCRPRFASFIGFIDSEANKFHKSDLQRQDIYVGVDYSTCKGFSLGLAVSESKGKIKSHMGKSRVEGNTGIIYLRKNLGAYFTAFGTVSGSIQDNHLHRPTYNGRVKSRSQSKSITGNIGLEFKGWQVNCFSFAPRANVVYSHAHVDKFKEKGAIDALHNSGYNARFVTGELGLSTLCSTTLWSRPFDIEAIIGVEQPFKYYKGRMDMYVVSDPEIGYKLSLANTAKTRLNGGLNFGYNLFKAVTLYGGYEVITGGDWNHIANAGLRIRL